MSTKLKFLIGSLLLVAACTQEAVWKSACGCAFNLSDSDRARAQLVALDGDAPAIEALSKHYYGDLGALWDSRASNPKQFATEVKAASLRAKSLALPDLRGWRVAAWREAAEVGDEAAILTMADYTTKIQLKDEAQLWTERLKDLERSSRGFVSLERTLQRAELAKSWPLQASFVEGAIEKISEIKDIRTNWLPYDRPVYAEYDKRIRKLIVARYSVNKSSISSEMCWIAGLHETNLTPQTAPVLDPCGYAKGEFRSLIVDP